MSQMAQEMPQERADVGLADVAVVETEVKTNAASPRTHRQRGDHRDLAVLVSVAHDGGFSAWGPGAARRPHQLEARFVHEDEMGTQVRSPFFMRGHCFCFQPLTRVSLRSRARRSGFWQLHPIRCKRRPT